MELNPDLTRKEDFKNLISLLIKFNPKTYEDLEFEYIEAVFSEVINSDQKLKDLKALFNRINSQLEKLGLTPITINARKTPIKGFGGIFLKSDL